MNGLGLALIPRLPKRLLLLPLPTLGVPIRGARTVLPTILQANLSTIGDRVQLLLLLIRGRIIVGVLLREEEVEVVEVEADPSLATK